MKAVAVFLSDEMTNRRLALAFRGRYRVESFSTVRDARDALINGHVLAVVVDMRHRSNAGDTNPLSVIAHLCANYPVVPVIGHLNFTPQHARDIMDAAHAGAAEIILNDIDDLGVVVTRVAEVGMASEVAHQVEAAVGPLVPSFARAYMSCAVKNARLGLDVNGVVVRLNVPRKRLARRLADAGLPKPAQLLNWMRLLLAARMMDEGTRTIEKTARILGFGSAAALRNMLHRYLGCSPDMLRTLGGFDYVLAELVRMITTRKPASPTR